VELLQKWKEYRQVTTDTIRHEEVEVSEATRFSRSEHRVQPFSNDRSASDDPICEVELRRNRDAIGFGFLMATTLLVFNARFPLLV